MFEVSADAIIEKDGRVLLIKRNFEPFKGYWCLPGGGLEEGETLEECIVREVREETGLEGSVESTVGVYSEPDRDPRGQVISAAFNLNIEGGEVDPGREVVEAQWFNLEQLPELGFDHEEMLEDYLEKRR